MLDSLILELLDCSGQTLLRASAITFSSPEKLYVDVIVCLS